MTSVEIATQNVETATTKFVDATLALARLLTPRRIVGASNLIVISSEARTVTATEGHAAAIWSRILELDNLEICA
jgi:hypothetical protein